MEKARQLLGVRVATGTQHVMRPIPPARDSAALAQVRQRDATPRNGAAPRVVPPQAWPLNLAEGGLCDAGASNFPSVQGFALPDALNTRLFSVLVTGENGKGDLVDTQHLPVCSDLFSPSSP